jgi:hypothetical protein
VTFKYALLASVALLPAVLSLGEAADQTAPLRCRIQSITCEAIGKPPSSPLADEPEREQLALHNPAQPAGASPAIAVAYDVGIPGFDIPPPRPTWGHLMDRPSDDGWLAAVA